MGLANFHSAHSFLESLVVATSQSKICPASCLESRNVVLGSLAYLGLGLVSNIAVIRSRSFDCVSGRTGQTRVIAILSAKPWSRLDRSRAGT